MDSNIEVIGRLKLPMELWCGSDGADFQDAMDYLSAAGFYAQGAILRVSDFRHGQA